MLRISSDQCVYFMNPSNPAVAEAAPGDTVRFETRDCWGTDARGKNDRFIKDGRSYGNPATGPLRVKGAEPGDVLAVHILDIEVAPQGAMVARPNVGALGHHIVQEETKTIPIVDGQAVFNDRISLPIRPMIGVIGVAPAAEDVPNTTPGPHGGNMDTRLITAGATLYLPVFVEGANLAMGDLHAVMADGEVVICGVEVPGEVTVKVDVIKGAALIGGPLPSPVLEAGDSLYCIASAKDLDEAQTLALDHTLAFLKARLPLSTNEIGMLMSLICHLQISQVVDPLKTVRVEIPKKPFEAYGLRF